MRVVVSQADVIVACAVNRYGSGLHSGEPRPGVTARMSYRVGGRNLRSRGGPGFPDGGAGPSPEHGHVYAQFKRANNASKHLLPDGG